MSNRNVNVVGMRHGASPCPTRILPYALQNESPTRRQTVYRGCASPSARRRPRPRSLVGPAKSEQDHGDAVWLDVRSKWT
jgi:hypothetical protein